MRKLIFVSLVSAIALWGCTTTTDDPTNTKGKGPITLGGVFKMNEVEDFRNFIHTTSLKW